MRHVPVVDPYRLLLLLKQPSPDTVADHHEPARAEREAVYRVKSETLPHK